LQRISERANALDAAALTAKREVELRTRECEEAQTELATVQVCDLIQKFLAFFLKYKTLIETCSK
jgi:hypothetical protein